MPKLKNVTEDEIASLMEKVFDLIQDVSDVSDRLSKSYSDDDIKELVNRSSSFAAFARDCAHMSVVLLSKARLEEQKRELSELMKKRASA